MTYLLSRIHLQVGTGNVTERLRSRARGYPQWGQVTVAVNFRQLLGIFSISDRSERNRHWWIFELTDDTDLPVCAGRAGLRIESSTTGLPVLHRRSGNSGSWSHHERHPGTCMTKHLDQSVDAEPLDLAPHQVAHPGLRHTQQRRRPPLRQTAIADQPLKPHHQLSPQLQMLGLLRGEAQIAEDVTKTPANPSTHPYPLS